MRSDMIEQLHDAADRSAEQLSIGVAIVESERDLEAVLAALGVLGRHQPIGPDEKERLLKRYVHAHENGPRRDSGCHIRSGILSCLRGAFTRQDVALLENAVLTREEIRNVEYAGPLRARALVALDDVDGELASYHAVRLLLDAKLQDPTNESAMTAVSVLSEHDRIRPLYLFALTGTGHPLIVSECLRSLLILPESLVHSLVARYSDNPIPAVSAGLIDLLIGHESWREFRREIIEALAGLNDPDAHFYAALAIVASRRTELVYDMVEIARDERDTEKLRNYVDALDTREVDDDIALAIKQMRRRLE